MEYVLLGLLVLSFPFIAIIALVKTASLKERMRSLEVQFAALERGVIAAAASRPVAAPAPPTVAAPPPPMPQPVAEPSAPLTFAPEPEPASPVPATAADAAPQSTASLEERFGTRWVVWVGGVALALGGIFLVKYSIEAGLIGPGMRLFFGALLAAALIATGEWARRKEQLSGIAGLPAAHIPGILTAAGTTIAYAVVYAAYGLYGFLSPEFAFVLLGIVALATLAAALLHGPALAGLGLVGAYVTPLLVASDQPNFWALYVYLAVVTAAAFALARIRLWRWLALTAVGFGLFWMLPGIADARSVSLAPHIFHVVVSYALAATLIVSGMFYGPPAEPGRVDPVSSIALAAYLAAAALLVLVTWHDPSALGAFTALTIATVAIAWRAEAAAAAVPFAALLAAVIVLHWSFDKEIVQLVAAPGVSDAPTQWRSDVTAHLWIGLGFAALFGAAGYLAQGRSIAALIPTLWSGAGLLAPIAILIALYCRLSGLERSIPFAGLALLCAALYGIATETLGKRAPRPGIATAQALHATGAVMALALALTFALDKGYLSVGLALMVPGVAWISEKRPLPMLRWLCAALVAVVAARTVWEPRIVGDTIGTTPIFNWLLWGYGVPALSFWAGGYLLRKRADDRPTRAVEASAILFTVLFAFLEIRHAMNGGDIYSDHGGLSELALQVCVGLAMTIGFEHLRLRTDSIVHNIGALVVAALTFAAIVLGLWLAANPLLTGDPVGGPFLNLILLGYGAPAALAIVLALRTRGRRPNAYRVCAATVAVALALSYLTLEVTRLYHGPRLFGPTTDAEQYTYSVVWLAYGVVLLLAGIALRSQPARLASAAITALTIAKVFLVDMAGLTGIWRALSFIGLGLVLVGIGWLYQRLLFPRKAMAAAGSPGTPPPQ